MILTTKKIIVVFLLVAPLTSRAQFERDLLTDFYTPKYVAGAIGYDQSWIPYPEYADRAGWEKVPEHIRTATISAGEEYLGFEWPMIQATQYLEFTRTGDRSEADKIISKKQHALQALVFAELLDGQGRFMDDIINGVFSFCEQTVWESPAHFYLYGFEGSIGNPTTILPDLDHPIIGLKAADIAADLAWTWHFFHKEFDKVSPVISQRLQHELDRKMLQPFYQRNDFWWMTGWGEGRVNNWTPWCSLNALTCILLLERDHSQRLYGIYKTMASVDIFINSYPQDGACSEGPAYWGHAAGKMYDYLQLLKVASKGRIDLFDNEIIRDMGRYIYRAYVGNGNNFVNFADAPLKLDPDAGRIYRFGRNIQDTTMMQFGAYLMECSLSPNMTMNGKLGETLEDLFNLNDWEKVKPAEPLVWDYYFPDLDMAIGREYEGKNNGFYFAAKGGSNGEMHNHNDVGSFMLYYNGSPVLIDVGVGTYTKKTFSNQRYDIWTMQSSYHNLPDINGIAQHQGGDYKAVGSAFSGTEVSVNYKTNISKAYTDKAQVNSWIRSYTLDRKSSNFVISDAYDLFVSNGKTTINFMSQVPVKVLKNGVLEFKGNGFTLHMRYDVSKLDASVQIMNIDDRKLLASLGKKIYRVIFSLKDDSHTGILKYVITKK